MESSSDSREIGRPGISRLFLSLAYATVAFDMKGMLAHSALRQFVMALLLLSSALPSIQSAFACRLMDGKLQIVCCCKGKDAMKGCKMGGGGCDANEVMPKGCCDITYVYQPLIDAVALPGSHAFQFLILDAPQSPPALLSSLLSPEPGISLQTGLYHDPAPPRGHGTKTYLITQRLRI